MRKGPEPCNDVDILALYPLSSCEDNFSNPKSFVDCWLIQMLFFLLKTT